MRNDAGRITRLLHVCADGDFDFVVRRCKGIIAREPKAGPYKILAAYALIKKRKSEEALEVLGTGSIGDLAGIPKEFVTAVQESLLAW